MKHILNPSVTFFARNLLTPRRESLAATVSRVLILLMLAQPMLVHAAPFVRGGEATAQRGVAKLRSWLPKTIETKAAEVAKPMAEKAISIDEWMTQSTGEPKIAANRTTNSNANSEAPLPAPDLKNFTTPFKIFPAMTMFQAGTSLEMGATGPAGNGPSTTAQAVTLFENASIAYTPTTTVTYTLSNQQFGAGTVQGLAANSAINFGGSGNAAADSPIGGFALYSLMNGISASTNAMYTACNSCTAGTTIDVATNRAISLNLITDALINAANTNLQALNARVYYGDITISFNRPVSNPVLQLTGMGGTSGISFNGSGITKNYDLGFSTEFDLVGSNVTLSKLNGNSVLNVTSTSITNSATRLGANSAGAAQNGITRTAASGSVLATGTNITSITLKMYVRGDGGIVVNSAGTVQTPDAGWEPKWAIAAGYLPPGASSAFVGSIGGDTILVGASIQKPVTVSGTVFNDTNGLSDSIINGTGTNAGGVNAILVDSAGNVVASTAVAADGTYSFTGIGEGSYTLRLSTTAGTQGAAAPAISLPATWFSRGEGTAAAGDGTVDGNTAITVASGVNLTGVNFGIAQPGLSLTKANPASFTTGIAGNYTLTVSNAANRPTSGTSIVVNDKLPPNFAYNSAAAGTGATGASCTSSGTVAAGLDLVCTITTAAGIAGGGSAAFTLNVTPQTAAGAVAGINKAAVDPAGGTPVAPSTCTATGTPAGCALAPSITPTIPPDLTLAKSHTGNFTIGSTGTYSFSVNNIGTGASSGTITVSDTLPTGLTVNGGAVGAVTPGGTNAADWTCNSNATSPQTITCTSSTAIAASGSSTFNFTVNVGASTPVGTNSITNSATVSGGGETNVANDSSSDPTTVVLPTFSCGTMFTSRTGVAAIYTINTSTAAVTQVGVLTAYTNGIALEPGTGNIYYYNAVGAAQLYVWNATTGTNTAIGSPIGGVTSAMVRMAFSPTGRLFGADGGTPATFFEINPATGAIISSGIVTYDVPPVGIGSGDMAFDANGVLFFTTATGLYTLNLTTRFGTQIAVIPFTVNGLAFDGAGTLYGENSANQNLYKINVNTGVTTLIGGTGIAASDLATCSFPTPILASSKTVAKVAGSGGATISPGDTLEYTITTTNSGNVPSTLTTLTDAIPTGSTYVASSAKLNGGAVADVSGAMPYVTAAEIHGVGMNAGVIGSDAGVNNVATVVFRVTVNSVSPPTTVSNQGTINFNSGTPLLTDDPGVGGTIDPTTVTVTEPVVAGYKSVKLTTDADSSGTITAGDTLTYTVQYANTGTIDVPSFQIADQLPTGLTISAAGAQTVTVSGTGTAATKDATYTGAALATSIVLASGATLTRQGTITVSIPVTVNAGFTGSLSNQASASGTGITTAVSTDNAGATADLPATVTAAPYNLTVPGSSVTQTITAAVDPTTVTVVAPTLSLGGKVFEDINYGGGVGRDFVSAPGAARPGVRVELYNSAGAFVGFTFTNATGDYTFSGLASGNYTVRVVDAYVTSSRTGGCTPSADGIALPACTQFAVQTFRTNGLTGNTGTADTVRVGGETPSLVDAGANTTNATLASLSTATNTPQSITPVTVGSSNITGIDFGFNFDTIVNTNNSGQGSLRQFILNSNALTNNASLAQVGQTSGTETSIFMIPDGAAHPGLRSGLTNQLNGSGVAVINIATTLQITDSDTVIDGKTQTANVGNTNAGTFGVGGIVGVGSVPLSTVNRPEVEITDGGASVRIGIDIRGNNTTIRGISIWGFGQVAGNATDEQILVGAAASVSNTLFEENIIGTPANSFSLAGAVGRATATNYGQGISIRSSSGAIVRNNLIGYLTGTGVLVQGVNTSLTVQNNEVRDNGGYTTRDGVAIESGTINSFVKENLITGSAANGVSIFNNGANSLNLVENNTITTSGSFPSPTETAGIAIFTGTGGNDTIRRNIINGNIGAGVWVATTMTGVKITQNSTYANGGLAIDLKGGTDPGAANQAIITGTVNGNDGATSASGYGNAGIDYPILTTASLSGSTLTIKGFVGNNGATGNPLFANVAIEIFKADNTPANNDGEVMLTDAQSKPHGEGRTYLGTITADANGLFDTTLTVSGLLAGDAITATTTDTAFSTSEFSSNFILNYNSVVAYKSVKLTTDADGSGSITPGDTLTYTINYANTGIVNISNFQINDALPAGLTAAAGAQTVTVAGTGTAATKNSSYTGAATGAVSDLLAASATLKVGGGITVTIPVTVGASVTGTLSNQAKGTGTELLAAGVLTDNASTTADLPSTVTAAPYNLTVPAGSVAQTIAATVDPTTVTIAATPTVLAFKSVKLATDVNSNTKADPGDTLIWSVWYKNTGTIDVTTFQISDALPAGVSITGAGNQTITITGATTATKSATYTGAAAGAVSDLLSATTTFKAGDLIQIDIPVTVNAGFAGALLNQAKGTGGNLLPTGVFTDNADNVTPGLPSGVTIPTGSAVQTLTLTLDPTSLTVTGVPVMTLVKSVTPTGDQQPGTDLTYKIVFTNTGNAAAQNIVIFDPIPNDTDFKLGSATMTLGTTGLTMIAEFSNDFVAATPAAATWTYAPVSAGGSADTGYDRNVKAVRWRVSAGTLSQTSPNHTGEVGFTVKIR